MRSIDVTSVPRGDLGGHSLVCADDDDTGLDCGHLREKNTEINEVQQDVNSNEESSSGQRISKNKRTSRLTEKHTHTNCFIMKRGLVMQ